MKTAIKTLYNPGLKLMFAVSVYLLTFSLSPAQVSDPRAKELAMDFFKAYDVKASAEAIKLRYQSVPGSPSHVSVFQSDKGGFVLISQTGPEHYIAGYSMTGSFIPGDVPDALQNLISLYEESENVPEKKTDSQTKADLVVAPLLDAQGVSLNQYWHSQVGGCPTGCTATAMAMLMAYYKYPDSGTGSPCYNHPEYGTLCADIENTVYDWNNMTDADYELLSYQMAIAMEMDFCGGKVGSAPMSPSYYSVLENYYGYYVYTGTTELYYLTNELDHGRPSYIEIPGDPGHAVVVDGYDSEGYYHINFGWGGSHNGYFLLNSGSTFHVGPAMTGYTFGTNIENARYIAREPQWTTEQDSLALVALHNSLGGTTGWDLSTPVIKWPGVVVMNERVMEVRLTGVEGSISPEIGKLTQLRRLSLGGNLHGSLPAEISTLTGLRELSLSSEEGSMAVTLPDEIGNLTMLETLSMYKSVQGPIPSTIGNLSNLKYLGLQSGGLTGSIPAATGNLAGLRYLYLKDNDLSGNIPESLGNLTSLVIADLSGNSLSGSIPAGIGNLNQLIYLYLNDNDLEGTLPETTGNCVNLTNLNLSGNGLEGDIPASIGNMTELEFLDLAHNTFTSLPEETGRLLKLKNINLEHNMLTAIPDSIINIPGIINFKANNNNIEYLPPDFGAWPELQETDLSYNKISSFPENLCLLTELWKIKLNNNLITALPASIDMMTGVAEVHLDSNMISGPVPEYHLSVDNNFFDLSHNHFRYKDIPESSSLVRGVGEQAFFSLSDSIIKGRQGDTLRIDIRDISSLSAPGNKYYWLEYPDLMLAEYHEEMAGEKEGPVLELVLNEKNVGRKFYCKVFNDDVSSFTWQWQEFTYTTPALRYLNTDTLTTGIYTEEELLRKDYPDKYIISSTELPEGNITGNDISLVSPFDLRGEIIWQGSTDSLNWYDISSAMQQQDILDNIVSVTEEELLVQPSRPVFYRCMLTEGDCDPLVSEPVKIYPLGEVLYDDIINVATDSLSVSVDSIQVILPGGLHDEDFRLTIIKLDDPPANDKGYTMGSAYDVSLSIGSVFEIPLIIRLGNLDLSGLDLLDLPAYKPVYYDDMEQQWVQYTEGGISLTDSVIEFHTPHLTKLSWWELSEGSYTHRFISDKVEVIYKYGTDTGEENNYLGYLYGLEDFPSEPWHNTITKPNAGGNPVLVQDIAGYMNQIINKFISLELQPPGSTFTVYVSNTGSGSLGHITLAGYNFGYFTINSALAASAEDLRQTLAHEYMHYTQSRYMNVLTSNYFWAEANAPLADRMVWNSDKHKKPESESHLRQSFRPSEGNKSIYDLLGRPWDAQTSLPVIEKRTVAPEDANLSSTFLHYMRSYREGTKLNAGSLLKAHATVQGITTVTWRQFLNDQLQAQLGTGIGSEYDEFVRYLLSGSNSKFTILNTGNANPLSNIIRNSGSANNGSFAKREVFFFEEDDTLQTKTMSIKIPYLASKVLVLSNNTPDKMVVVNYKPTFEADENKKVYHGKYNFESGIMEFTDISDSTSYSLLLDARSEKSVRECQNTSFLLFVNTKCPDVLSFDNDFDAGFELKAFPVINIDDLAYANVSDKKIHNYSDGQKREFLISGLLDLQKTGLFTETLLTDYTHRKEMVNDSAYIITVSFVQEARVYNGQDVAANRYIFTRSQTIEYNFLSGRIIISQDNHEKGVFEEYYTAISGTYNPEVTFYTKTETHTLELKNVHDFEQQTYELAGDVQEFITAGTTETRAALVGISHTASYTSFDSAGEWEFTNNYSYVSTDYPDNTIKIILQLHYR